MRSFQSDCREAYVISNSYGMGDPLASRFEEAGRTAEGGGITHRNCLKSPGREARNRRKDFITILLEVQLKCVIISFIPFRIH